MTADQFRKLALSFPDTVEAEHQGHPDFRFGKNVFASLGYPDDAHGMVKISPELQVELMREEPEVYFPAAGTWGRGGSTCVRLKMAKVKSLREVMKAALESRK